MLQRWLGIYIRHAGIIILQSRDLFKIRELCKNILKSIKRKDILNCHSPILTCLLLCEFLYQISDISIHNSSKCTNLAINLLTFSKSIQDANTEENYIKFLMTQRDTKGRTAFQIAADNGFYKVLETNEIGTTINKMWNGKNTHQGFFYASSLHRYLENADLKSMDPFQNFDSLEQNQTYFYQLYVWTDSCSLRYWPESLSTIILILIYNLYIFFLVNENMVMQPVSLHSGFNKFLLYLHTFWTSSIALNLINKLIFCIKTKRKYLIDEWLISEILLFLGTITLYLDISAIFGTDYQNPPSLVFFIRTGILSINDALVWMRITGLLLTFRDIGPLLRMVYIMSLELVKYMILFSLWIVCCAGFFTATLSNYSGQFATFSYSVTTLFGGFLNNFNYDFSDYYAFASILIISYITVSGMVCANLLIAILSSMFNTLSVFVDASHRSVLLSYYRISKWDKKYGYLIFLTTPLNLINFITFPLSFFIDDTEESLENGKKKNRLVEYNEFVTKVYYIIYLIVILMIYLLYSIIILPICYIKGIGFAVGNELNLNNSHLNSFNNVIKWICYGPIFLLRIIGRDLYDMCSNVYNKAETKRTEIERIKQYIKPEDVIIFLQFCHSKSKEDHNDLHSLFMDYLSFESRKKAENNEQIREKSIYINKLNNAGKVNSIKKKPLIHHGLLMYKDEEDIGFTSKFVKKNLIIIEILENFLIDDSTDNYIVDIEKLKMLLPKTRNINKDYIKRLIHTDIISLNKAVNHMKQKQNVFIQIKMLDKIVDSTIRVNDEIDNDAKKLQKKKNNLTTLEENSSVKSKEIDEQIRDQDFYSDLQNLLMKITEELKNSIKNKSIHDSKK